MLRAEGGLGVAHGGQHPAPVGVRPAHGGLHQGGAHHRLGQPLGVLLAAGEIMVCGQGDGLPFDEARAKEILSQKEVVIAVDLHEGEDEAECWGCDLTAEYVHINGDYRS